MRHQSIAGHHAHTHLQLEQFNKASPSTDIFLGGSRKLENVKETLTDTGRTCKTQRVRIKPGTLELSSGNVTHCATVTFQLYTADIDGIPPIMFS